MRRVIAFDRVKVGRSRGGIRVAALERESIGQPECPLFYRWTLWNRWGYKVMVHHFLPGLEDPDTHDHPRPFVTFLLRGAYLDINRHGEREVMQAPKVKHRAAAYAHRTKTGRRGAWTLVVMGPVQRPWGFWRDGQWYDYWTFGERFGFQRICDV